MVHDHALLSVYQTQRLKDKNGAIRSVLRSIPPDPSTDGDDFEQNSRDLIHSNQVEKKE
jgi:hypothetical protein